jgi:hypothetical protein
MSQKEILKGLKKHHFWIIVAVVAMTAIGIYWTTSSGLAKTFDERKAAIEQKIQTATQLNSKTNHPNDDTHAQMEVLIRALQGQVRQVWDEQYRHQVGSILVWPRELRPELRTAVKRLKGDKPIESIAYPLPPENEIKRELREHYRDYIKQELPKLAKIIGAKWQVSLQSSGGGGYGGGSYGSDYGGGYGTEGYDTGATYGTEGYGSGGNRPAEPEYIVNWNSSNQGHLQNTRFDWGTLPPSTLEMFYAQEDLWVLRAIMEIIAKTNEGADSHHKAAIKEITAVELGVDVGPQRGRVMRPQAPGAAASMESGYGSEMSPDMTGDAAYSPSGEGSSDLAATGSAEAMSTEGAYGMAPAARDPAHRRYVDKDYLPLAGADIRNAQTESDPAKAYLAVAKRMPVRLRLVMDQRRLQRLLTECGNSPLTLEVRQVRINETSGATGGYGGGYGASYGGSESGSDMSYGSGDYGGGQQKTQSQFDLPIEIYGIIYIYNPANPEKLGIDPNQETVAMR